MPPLLRAATPDDAPALVAVIHAAFEEHRGALEPPSSAHAETADSIRRKLADAGAALAEIDGVAVGCVFFREEPRRVYLSKLAVHPEYRCQGIGRQLVEYVEQEALARQQPKVYLGVRNVLDRQRAYYERLGFRTIGEAAHPGFAQPTYLIMEKDLDTADE